MSDNNKFIAELHDIGKIVNTQALNQQGIQISGQNNSSCFLQNLMNL